MKEFRLEIFKKGHIETRLVRADKVFVTDNLVSFVKFYRYAGEDNTTSEIIYSVKASLIDEMIDLSEEDSVEILNNVKV